MYLEEFSCRWLVLPLLWSLCTGSAVTVDVDDKSSRHTVDDGVVHDPLHVSIDTISLGGTVTPLVIGSQTATSASVNQSINQSINQDFNSSLQMATRQSKIHIC